VIQGGSRDGGGRGGPNENDPTGEADTLAGKKMATFGDLAQREKPPQTEKLKKKASQEEKKKGKDIVDPKKHTKFVRDQFKAHHAF
jgi:hypothetical protein